MKLSSNTLPLLVAAASFSGAALLHDCRTTAESLNEDIVLELKDHLLKACGGNVEGPTSVCDGHDTEAYCRVFESTEELVFTPSSVFHNKAGVVEGDGSESVLEVYNGCIESEAANVMRESFNGDGLSYNVIGPLMREDCTWSLGSGYNRTEAAMGFASDSVRVSSSVDCLSR